jgi:hypothetical protein
VVVVVADIPKQHFLYRHCPQLSLSQFQPEERAEQPSRQQSVIRGVAQIPRHSGRWFRHSAAAGGKAAHRLPPREVAAAAVTSQEVAPALVEVAGAAV